MIVVDHVAVRRGVWASRRATLGLDLQPRLTQRLGEVVVHRAGDGHRVCYGLGLLVVLAQTATEMLLDDGVTGGVRCRHRERVLLNSTHKLLINGTFHR